MEKEKNKVKKTGVKQRERTLNKERTISESEQRKGERNGIKREQGENEGK